MAKKSFMEDLESAPEEYAKTYSDSVRKLGDAASDIGGRAVEKIKQMGERTAKEARNYGRMYKEGLGMKPDTPYEKKKGGVIKSSASSRADGIAQRGKTRGRIC
jgi:hypothetical protein